MLNPYMKPEKKRRDLSLVYKDQDKEVGIKR